MERPPLPSNDEPNSGPSRYNGFANGSEGSKALDSPGSQRNNGRTEPLPETRPWSTADHSKMPLKEEPSSEDSEPKDDQGFSWSGADSNPKGPVGAVVETSVGSFEKVRSSHRMRLLPNRNAVYETDALLPATPEPPEPEVLIVTPEMPCAEAEPDEPPVFQAASFPAASFQNEPTDLSVRRMNGNVGARRGEEAGTGLTGVATEPSTSQSLILRPLRVLTGQMGSEYPTKDSRSPSPFLAPPFMHSAAAAAAVSGLQNHLVHLQQQQQHAIQLAAMSRAFNFHFGPGVHPLKGLTRSDCERPTYAYKTASLPCTPAPPPPTSMTQLGLSDKAARDQKKRSRVFIDPLTEIPKLERWFSEDTHPSSYVIEKFTDELNRSPYRQRFPKLEPKNLQLWFKNHRAKMKRHRDLVPSQQPPTAVQGFDATVRTPSPSSFYSDWADRSSTPGFVAKMEPGHVRMTSSCTSPSSSTGSRIASSPAPDTKSASDSSDEEMDICPEDSNRQEGDD